VRVFVVAGEASGDHHAAAVVRELRARRPGIEIDALGMDELAAAGARIVFDMRELAVMWFAAVIARLPTFMGLIRRIFREWRDNPPDAILLVDYPGLNLVLARRARKLGIPVVYYIPPQLWAWAPWRRRQVARRVDRVLTVLPFEAEFFADAGVEASHVGHPLGDQEWPEPAPESGRVLLLPGSRSAELDAHLRLFLEVARSLAEHHPEARFTLVEAREKHRGVIEEALDEFEALDVEVVPATRGRDEMRRAWLAIAKSGTTTLELGLAGVPTVIVYRVSPLARLVGRMHMTSPYIGLVNVVAGREIAPELLVSSADPAPILEHALELYAPGSAREDALAACRQVRETMLGGRSAAHVADAVLEVIG
jgi:lipid-A-disaccharide synthase